ncbi:hypothetical protein VMCG_01400 [Cytospora schulzeri]|uniref:Uncharacterized protein n=1 Tax=Cytospora schulzeri TaxID=448051 RepID=A0A423X681_9PEZI|nr:hypothetical protein VMCG_01400 [Valsa malicola]
MESELRNKEIVPDGSATKHDKGKGKGKGKEMASGEKQSDTEDSIMSRVGKSATELSRTMLQGTSAAGDLADVAVSGKPGAPSSNKPVALNESSSAVPPSSTFKNSVFRSGQAEAHTAAEESAFSQFLDDNSAFVTAKPIGLELAWHEATRGSPSHNIYGQSTVAVVASVAEQQEQDGIEVAHLLSQTDEDMPKHGGDIMVSETELVTLRQALFEDGLHAQLSGTDWNNALNFIPDFLRGNGAGGEENGPSVNSYLNLGVTDPAEAGSLWLEQWNRVLTSYTDEVWGDLGDLVKKAKTEVEQLKEGNNAEPTDTPAVRQLRSILKRVRARL